MSRKIRVLYTIPNFDTAGSGRSVYDLVKHIDRSKFEPEICVTRDDGAFYNKVEQLDVKIHVFPFKTKLRPWISYPLRVLRISQFFRKNRFDIIHSWNWSSDISEPLAAKLASVPYIYTKKAMGWSAKNWKRKSKLSTRIIAVNQDIIDLYLQDMTEKVVRFPLAINTDQYKRKVFNSDISKSTYFKQDDFVIVSVANLVAVKGIEVLLEAVNSLNDDKIKVLIVGNDKNDYAQQLKAHYKSNSNIVFTGKHMEVRPFLELADLFVIPTKDEGRREGIPNAPLEAMAMECVVLGSNVSGVKDILSAFPECIFEPSNVQMLAEKIRWIKHMPITDKRALATKMRNQVVEEFSIKEFLRNHETLYLSIVN